MFGFNFFFVCFFGEDPNYALVGINEGSDYKYSRQFLLVEARVLVLSEVVLRKEFPEHLICL